MILVVDEDPANVLILEMFLRTLQLDCITALSGRIALESIRADKVKVLITSSKMTLMNGVQLLKICRDEKHHFPVIMIAEDAEIIAAESIILNDCCASLIKRPITFEILERALHAANNREHHVDCVHNKVH